MNRWTLFRDKLAGLLTSRKFWVLTASLVAVAGAYATGEITAWQAIQATVASLGLFSTGVALEDFGKGSKAGSG